MPTTNSEQGNRRFPRVNQVIIIEVSPLVYPLPKDRGQEAMSKNIGQGGICFSLPEPHPPGTHLNLKIGIVGWHRHKKSFAETIYEDLAMKPLTAIAEVVWCQPLSGDSGYDIGVRFVNIYEDDYKALSKYLNELI